MAFINHFLPDFSKTALETPLCPDFLSQQQRFFFLKWLSRFHTPCVFNSPCSFLFGSSHKGGLPSSWPLLRGEIPRSCRPFPFKGRSVLWIQKSIPPSHAWPPQAAFPATLFRSADGGRVLLSQLPRTFEIPLVSQILEGSLLFVRLFLLVLWPYFGL